MAHAATDTWVGGQAGNTNTWTITNNWSIGGSLAVGVKTNGDDLVFGATATMNPNNNFTNLTIISMTISTNGYVITGSALQLTNGITDNSTLGSNSISIPITLGKSQTFQNNVGGASNTQTTVSGTIAFGTNNLTIGGNGSFFLTGNISSTNSGTLTVNNGSGVVRLSGINPFGTNVVQVTNFIASPTYTTNSTIYTNSYVVVGVSTNYTYFTNTTFGTNGTLTYVTNTMGPQNAYAVTVSAGTLQLGNVSALPNGPNVGSMLLNGKLDLNGFNGPADGLDGSSSGRVGNYNTVATAATAVYTMTVGAGNSNGIFSGIIENGSQGTVALTKTGWGTEQLDNANTYSGLTAINQGTLKVTSNGSIGAGSQVLAISSGAIFDVSAWNAFGGLPTAGPLNVSAGTPTKPYTNFLGSYDPFYPTYVVSVSGTNNVITFQTNTDLATFTNVVRTTNFVTLTYSTNSIISIIDADVIGSFNAYGGGQISPSTPVSPGIATWKINGNLDIENYNGLGAPNNVNRANFLLNTNTTPGGGTNDYIYVTGTLNVGDELDVVVTPLYGSLASGTYTLFHSDGGYTGTGSQLGDPANLVLFAARGISGTFDTSDGFNIKLQASGTATPASNLLWSATSLANNNWDTHVTQNWKTNGLSTFFFTQDNVLFDDTGFGTVNLPNIVNVSSVTFNNNATNYSFIASANNFITGTGALTKNGTGQTTLQNPNSFIGDTTVNSGTLLLAAVPTIGVYHNLYNGVPAGNLVLGGGTISQLGTANQSPDTDFENLTVNPGASSITHQNARQSNETPVWVLSNSVTRAVGGVLSFGVANRAGSRAGFLFVSTNSPDGTNDYGSNGILGGWAVVNGNNDWVTAGLDVGAAPQGAVAYANYQANNNPAQWGSASNVLIGGSGGVVPTTVNISSSTSIYTLRFTNGSVVNVNISGGQTLTVSSGGILVPSAGVYLNTINGGTLKGAAGNDLVLLNNNSSAGSSLTVGSVIADNGGATGLTTGGGGTTILTGNDTYTGPTYINGGFAGTAPGVLQVGANGTSGSIASSSAVIDNGTLAFNRSDNDSVSGVISGSGNLTKLSAGALTLIANNTLSGLVTVSAGTLQLGNGGAAGSVSNAVSIVDNANLVFDNNNTVGYKNPISGYGSLVQFGSGNLVIATNETYSGITIVSNGTMTLTATGYLTNTASIAVNSGAVLDVSALAGGLTLRSAVPAEVLSGSGTINGSITTSSGTTLSPGFNGAVGTLTINNNLTLNGGSFNFSVNNAAGNVGGSQVSVGGTLTENSGTVVVINVLNGPLANGVYPLIHATGGISGSAANLGLFGFNQPGQIGVLTNEASGNLSLLVYSGTITALTWAGSGYGGASDAWNLSSLNWSNSPGALVSYANPDFALFDEAVSFTNPVDIQVAISSTAITVNSTNFNFTLGNGSSASKITGGASLVKNGPGLLTLLTTNDYLGTTVINGGTVQLGNNTAQAADGMVGGSGAITLNGTLVASNFTTETINGPISGAGQLVQKGVGKLILAGNNSGFSGGIWATNYLQVGNGNSGNLGTGPVTNNRTLLFNVGPTPSSSITVSGNISGSGGITNLGPGIVQLNGNNTYAGSTVVNIGTLRLGSGTALPATTSVYMDDTNTPGSVGTLDLNGNSISIASFQGANTGNGTAGLISPVILNNGSGTATITIGSGSNTVYSGQILDNSGVGGKVALLVTNNSVVVLSPAYNNLNIVTAPNLFSGGITISNAVVELCIPTPGGGATPPGNWGGAAAGLGTITLLGGHGLVTNSAIRMPTNGMLFAADNWGSSTPTVASQIGVVNVPAGETGTIFGPQRGQFACTLQGGGTLVYVPNLVRSRLGGDWSGFTGTVIFEQFTNGTGGNIGWDSPLGLPNATVFMAISNTAGSAVSISGTAGGAVYPIGALSGGDSSSIVGGGGLGGGGGGNGAANTIWAIGGLNLTTTNGSQIPDVGTGLRKVGSGILTLTNWNMSFGGQCVVSNGTLAFMPMGTNATNAAVTGPMYYLATNYLTCSNFTVVDPGVLDVTATNVTTLYVGHLSVANASLSQSLFGNGTINGNLIVSNNLIAPAWGASSRGTIPGNLRVTGSAIVAGGSTIQMAFIRTNSPVYDSFTANTATSPTPPTINRAGLTVINGGDALFPAGSSNVFRFFNSAVPVNLGGTTGITNIIRPNVTGCIWVTNLTLDGSMALVNTNSATVPFTNVPGITNFSLAGLNVQLNGTNGQSGSPYYLRVSTNAALSFSNWLTVATNTFSSAGGFTFIGTNVVDTNAQQQFYILSNTNR
jgi:fibronectin-binding autotransporter adhesin